MNEHPENTAPPRRGVSQTLPPLGENALQQSIRFAKGVGDATAKRLEKKNIQTVEDALFDLPLRYENRAALAPIVDVREGLWATIRASVKDATIARTRKGKGILTVLVSDPTGSLMVKWFSFRGKVPDKRFAVNTELILSGVVNRYQGRLEMHHPDVEVLEAQGSEMALKAEEKIVPIYSLTQGLNQRFYRKLVRQVAERFSPLVKESLPEFLRSKYQFPTLAESLLRLHCPEKDEDVNLLNGHRTKAQHRIIFEELFFMSLLVAQRKLQIGQLKSFAMTQKGLLCRGLMNRLTFKLTGAQKRVIREIFADLEKPFSMNRLVQGDVGCGKTLVAILSGLRVIENKFQTAFMAPTEILAEQHYLTWHRHLAALGVRTALLTGSTAKKDRERVLQDLASGEVQMLFGTHALIQQDVIYGRLGLVIIDEQHRFGVMQRMELKQKGDNPHTLVMTATPIPRTLAMTIYGDLDLSVIDEMPPGRKPVHTQVFRENQRSLLFRLMSEEVRKGHQVYVVYPLIEESETLDLKDAQKNFEEMKHVFPQIKLELLHGRMKAKEKEEIMQRFKGKEIDVLVSTTVIEVGIDVPNASLMVIENAERFGLFQLHQLRGRVGRGGTASRCILSVKHALTQEAKARLAIMTKTNDGFRIAEEDLRIRGPGELLGVRQAGLPIFCYAELRRDADIFFEANEEAKNIIAQDATLALPEHEILRRAMQGQKKSKLQFLNVG